MIVGCIEVSRHCLVSRGHNLGSVCHPRCVYETRKWYVVRHNCVTKCVFSDYNGQLHVSACTGHLQVVLGDLNLRRYYKHSFTFCK